MYRPGTGGLRGPRVWKPLNLGHSVIQLLDESACGSLASLLVPLSGRPSLHHRLLVEGPQA